MLMYTAGKYTKYRFTKTEKEERIWHAEHRLQYSGNIIYQSGQLNHEISFVLFL